jgi:Mg2+-importing ATPase
MLLLSIFLRFIQESRADSAAQKLKALVLTTATAFRDKSKKEVPLKTLVPGDIIELSAGDLVPADVRLIESRDLFVNQSALTGESLPVDKHAQALTTLPKDEFDCSNFCFMGTNIESGIATALIVATGSATRFGQLALSVTKKREISSFDIGLRKFTWLLLRLIFVMVPLVFIVNGFSKGSWLDAFFFALAIAVGLTPEMLPMIVTVNLSKGALDMSKKKVIIKRLNAIQNFGAMDTLCTDKTGTITAGKVALIQHMDLHGEESQEVLDYATINSSFQTGLQNIMDDAILRHDKKKTQQLLKTYKKIDELPFDFVRRRLSVIVSSSKEKHLLICKGATEEVLQLTKTVLARGTEKTITAADRQRVRKLIDKWSNEGFRLMAVAYKHLPASKTVYTVKDETDLILMGFLAFLDPPKASATEALASLSNLGVTVKVLTGDNVLVARKVCSEVGLNTDSILSGSDIQALTDKQLIPKLETTSVFAKLTPADKERIIGLLRRQKHVVGYLGDGINDAPALRAADVGISVDGGVDIAKESADIILLEKNLKVLAEGVREGRKVFGNIIKYVRMTASSNFGNMFSVLGASIFLPFLPMLPLQIITNNLLYDISQLTIPTDAVDESYLTKPRQWNISNITRYIFFLGPVSSLFDYATFAIMLFAFNAWANPALFQTGWFVESLVSQTLIIHIIRTNKIPFIQSRASLPLTLSTFGIILLGAWLPFSPFASALGFVQLPALYWLYLGIFVLLYFVLATIVKTVFIHRFHQEE